MHQISEALLNSFMVPTLCKELPSPIAPFKVNRKHTFGKCVKSGAAPNTTINNTETTTTVDNCNSYRKQKIFSQLALQKKKMLAK